MMHGGFGVFLKFGLDWAFYKVVFAEVWLLRSMLYFVNSCFQSPTSQLFCRGSIKVSSSWGQG